MKKEDYLGIEVDNLKKRDNQKKQLKSLEEALKLNKEEKKEDIEKIEKELSLIHI